MKYKEPDLTIITTVFYEKDEILIRLAKSIKNQKYSGKINHIFINDNVNQPRKIPSLTIINNKSNLGLASTLNKGFKLAKTGIVISLMDDCLPSSRDWLRKLISPFSDQKVAATTSNVEMPQKFWDNFDYFAKALTEKEQKIITPGLDEKGCAYRVSALKEFGYINDKEFKNGGEDTDLTIKIEQSNKWKLVHSEAKIFHNHFFTFRSRIRKEVQYARLSGLVSKKHFFKLPWNFRIPVIVRLSSTLFFLLSLFFESTLFLSVLLVLLISNYRLPYQIKRLGISTKTVSVMAINIYVYFLYVVNYSYAFLFKTKV